jgi:hypothetical protein
MGGWGSGRPSGYRKRKAENALPVDIRKWNRQGLIYPGSRITSSWSIGGRVYSSIGAVAWADRLTLHYNHRGEPVEQDIMFTWTRCNFGGKRTWLVCPFCHRRCAVIYSCGKYFACRICGGMVYRTQSESRRERLFSKAEKLRKKIGAKAGAANPLPIFKPKNMHYTTWIRIRWQIELLESRGFADLDRMLRLWRKNRQGF